MTKEQFETVYYPKYRTVIIAIARRLAKADYDLFTDLCQEGYIALWKCSPEKAHRSVDTYVHQAVKYRMIDYLRKHDRATHLSLDALSEIGVQVMATRGGAQVLLPMGPPGRDMFGGLPPAEEDRDR